MSVDNRARLFAKLEKDAVRRSRFHLAKIFFGLVILATVLAGLYVALSGVLGGLGAGLIAVGLACGLMVALLATARRGLSAPL